MSWDLSSIFELTNARAKAVAVVDANGDQVTTFPIVFAAPATATITTVASSASSVQLLAANPARRKFVIQNESSKVLKVAYGVTATAAVYTLIIPANSAYESELGDFTGVLNGIWSSANGNARITEITT